MACHHHIEGACPVCDRVEAFKQNPPAIVEANPLHLQDAAGGPVCGTEMGPGDRFSTRSAHSTERFCRLCLVVNRARERSAWAAEAKAWRARPFSEKLANFNRQLGATSDYGAIAAWIFKLSALAIIGTVAGVAMLFAGWGAGLAAALVTVLVLWRVGVALS